MMNCNNLIANGIIVRYIATIVSFYFISLNITNKFIHNYFYLILPILLTLLDLLDGIFAKIDEIKNGINKCTKKFYYQYNDKICDSISYLLLFWFFKLDINLLFFVIYRVIGVILFVITKDSRWLILFFDFAKEYLLYLFLFRNNYSYIPIFVLFKICYEYYYHTIHNKNSY